MANPNDIMAGITHPAQRESFLEARKKLRAARMKLIEENEAPEEYIIGEPCGVTIKTPFQIGKIQSSKEDYFGGSYEDHDGHKVFHPSGKGGVVDAYKDGKTPAVPKDKLLSQVETELDETIREYLQIEGVAVSGKPGDALAFVSETDRPQHPPMLKGESHEEWFTRVSNAYTATSESAAQAGGSGTDTDRVRRSGSDDPGDGRQTPAAGADFRRDDGASVDCVALADGVVEERSGSADAADAAATGSAAGGE